MSIKNDVAVSVVDIHKEFILPQNKNTTFKQTVVNIVKKNNKVTQKVLDGVSFEVNKGDFFGIVGRNGSGKSTLLKLLAGVYVPTAGDVQINGKLTPFIELGVGFNPELSGRDNVYLNGALLGFNRKQMDGMFDEIIEFAELGPYIDQKLKNYSSGMQVRLAFSIAIKAKNDVLIFDEVLAVGDEAFQRKCLDVFEQYKANGQTVILVTHDMETVRQFCSKAMLLDAGKIIEFGDPRKVASKYSKLNQEEIDGQSEKKNAKIHNSLKVSLVDPVTKKSRTSYVKGSDMSVVVKWKDLGLLESVGINIFKESGEHITGHNSRFSKTAHILDGESCAITYTLNLKPGKYKIIAEAYEKEGKSVESLIDGPTFSILSSEDTQTWSGLVDIPHQWR